MPSRWTISIHAPRVGRDDSRHFGDTTRAAFQSTRPVWGATAAARLRCYFLSRYFNPRAPCGARPRPASLLRRAKNFNPRAPCGARRCFVPARSPPRHFNPRAPCGARRRMVCGGYANGRFQSTRPVWGATLQPQYVVGVDIFQSTRPVWGATRSGTHSRIC